MPAVVWIARGCRRGDGSVEFDNAVMGADEGAEPLVLPRLEAEDLVLREWRDTDLSLIRDVSRDPYIPLITSVPADYSEAAGLAFIQRQRGRLKSREGYPFVIAGGADSRAFGAIGMWVRDAERGRAGVGYWLASSARGRGAAAKALSAMSEWAIGKLGVVRLELFVEPWNIASWRTAEKAGFAREGLLRKRELIGGEWKDMFIYSKVRAST
jgi:RimJ/RimL family protein N-acetyltransferase